MKLVLSIFRESLFSLNQLEIFFNLIFISFTSWIGSLWGKRILVSSAKIMKWEEGEERGRSFMYKKIKVNQGLILVVRRK